MAGRANVVNNFYASTSGDGNDALIICTGLPSQSKCDNDSTNIARADVDGNFSADGVNLNNRGSEATAFPAAAVTTDDAQIAACRIRDGAVVRPLDPLGQTYVSTIPLSACAVGPILSLTRSRGGSGTVTSSPAGISCGGDCTESYAAGTVVTLNAIPAPNSSVAGWAATRIARTAS